jgi:hypothetical protein
MTGAGRDRAIGAGEGQSGAGEGQRNGAVAWGEQATAPVSRDPDAEGVCVPTGPLRRYPES